MRRSLRIGLLVLGLALGLVGGAALIVYRSSQQVPEFYRQAIATPPEEQAVASQQMIEQTANLASHAQKPGTWEALFTTEQINGWLAVDLVKNHHQALPPEMSEPRVKISADRVSVGCRWTANEVCTVFSLDAELYLAEPNVIALRILGAHAGALPLPLAQILDGISRGAEELNLRMRWLLADRDPVALITLPPPESDEKTSLQIDVLELQEGAIYLAGRTVPKAQPEIDAKSQAVNTRPSKGQAAEPQVVKAKHADQSAAQQKVQR